MKSTPASPCQRGGRRFAAELRSASASRAKPACEPGLVLQKSKAPSTVSSAGLSATEDQRALRSACVARAPLPTISSPSQPNMRARCSRSSASGQRATSATGRRPNICVIRSKLDTRVQRLPAKRAVSKRHPRERNSAVLARGGVPAAVRTRRRRQLPLRLRGELSAGFRSIQSMLGSSRCEPSRTSKSANERSIPSSRMACASLASVHQ